MQKFGVFFGSVCGSFSTRAFFLSLGAEREEEEEEEKEKEKEKEKETFASLLQGRRRRRRLLGRFKPAGSLAHSSK